MFKEIKVKKCFTIDETELEHSTPTAISHSKTNRLNFSLKPQETQHIQPLCAEDEEIRRITQQTSKTHSQVSLSTKFVSSPASGLNL